MNIKCNEIKLNKQLEWNVSFFWSKVFNLQMIQDYIKNTHAPTHNQYAMKVLDVFEVDKDLEAANFNDVGNRLV